MYIKETTHFKRHSCFWSGFAVGAGVAAALAVGILIVFLISL